MRRKVVSVVLSAAMMVSMAGALTAFGGETEAASGTEAGTEAFTESPEGSGLIKDGVFSIANECGYAPYNWSQPDDSNDSVPIWLSTRKPSRACRSRIPASIQMAMMS